jgi:hypothetical protein
VTLIDQAVPIDGVDINAILAARQALADASEAPAAIGPSSG